MTPARYNLTIYQGATLRLPIQWTADEAPVDLTGCTIKAKGKYPDQQGLLFDLSIGSGINVVDPVLGKIEIVISAQKTGEMDFVAGSWELDVTNPQGEVYRVVMGYLSLSKEVRP